MVEEVLVKEILSAQEIAAGEELLRRLDSAGANVIAAYWIYTPGAGVWTLDIVSPQVESEGPIEFYNKIHRLVSVPTKIPCGLDIHIITVSGPNYTFYKLLSSTIKSKTELSGVRLRQYVVGDEIVDLYVYRFPRTNDVKK
jgi:hypothetical protein